MNRNSKKEKREQSIGNTGKSKQIRKMGVDAEASHQYYLLRKENSHFRQKAMMNLLSKLETRRKRYSFQVMKQFFLFPDETISDDLSIDTYDRIFYHDEHLHTIVKIYETKQVQNKIWAFMNLRTLKMQKKLGKMVQRLQKMKEEHEYEIKQFSFNNIRQYSLRIPPSISEVSQVENNSITIDPLESRKRDKEAEVQSETTHRTNVIEKNSTMIRSIERGSIRVIYPSKQERQGELSTYKVIGVRRGEDGGREQNYEENSKKDRFKDIRIEPLRVYSSNGVVKQMEKKDKSYGEHYVHTVHGDCTININCALSKQDNDFMSQNESLSTRNEARGRKERVEKGERTMIKESSCLEREKQLYCCCCPCYIECCCAGVGRRGGYDIEQRLRYLEFLEREVANRGK